MSLLTIARYRAITGDVASESVAVSAAIEDAQDLLADALGRELEQATYTENLWPTRDGRLWPSVLPLVSATGFTVDGDGILGVFGPGWPNLTGAITVQYVGGWLERTANPTSPYALPAYIERDLAIAAQQLLAPVVQEYPTGAIAVRLGDASVQFGPNGAPRAGEDAAQWSRRTLRHRFMTTRGTGEWMGDWTSP